MLPEFIRTNRDDLVALCTARAARRAGAAESPADSRFGTRQFLEALPSALSAATGSDAGDPIEESPHAGLADIDSIAARHGMEMLASGAPLDWVVHEYGDVCQAITQLAQRRKAAIPVRDFESLNWCLDNAMAAAVSEYAHQRELLAARESSETLHECLGRLADELRAPLREGNLVALREVIDRSLAVIRLRSGMTACPETIAIADLVRDLSVWGTMEAQASGCQLDVLPVDPGLAVYADRALLVSSLRRLLAAAYRSAAQKGSIALGVRASNSRVFIEVHDALPEGTRKRSRFARSIELRGTSRISPDGERALVERSVQDNGGRLRVRELPGGARVYAIDLPRERSSERT